MKKWDIKDISSPGHSLPGHLPPAAVRVLLARGLETERQLMFLLQPPHRLPYNPMRLDGMETAVQRILQLAREAGDGQDGPKVGIVGDFDVDGITGTALLVEGLGQLGLKTVPYLPHRVAEGHGLSTTAVQYMAEQGVRLILTVDCGVSSVPEVAQANALGMDVIVTDHHVPPEHPPAATAIINPHVTGNEYPFPHLCGAGLALKLMQGVFQLQGKCLPPGLVELAALGTIADLVPLEDENRYLVKEGLKILSRTERPGLKAIYRLAGLEGKPITSETVAFQLSPRLNAAGRMGHAGDSLRLLTTISRQEADALAEKLEGQNRERRLLTGEVVAAVHSQVAALDDVPPFMVAEHPGITPGIAGLVAGHLADSFQRPAVALAQIDEELITASGRSVPAFNLIAALNSCADLFVRHGGHSQAAGFTIARANIPTLKARLAEIAAETLAGVDTTPTLPVDCELGLAEITPALLELLDQLEPFGAGNPKPLFLTRGLEVVEARKIGSEGQHLKLLVSDDKKRLPALIFNLKEEWPAYSGPVDLVYTISVDYWRGRKQISLVVEDFLPSHHK